MVPLLLEFSASFPPNLFQNGERLPFVLKTRKFWGLRIEMERFILVEIFQKKRNTF